MCSAFWLVTNVLGPNNRAVESQTADKTPILNKMLHHILFLDLCNAFWLVANIPKYRTVESQIADSTYSWHRMLCHGVKADQKN